MAYHRTLLDRLLSVVVICLTAFVGDNLTNITNNRLLKALCDNLTHGAIGALTWITAAHFASLHRGQAINTALCTVLAMLIDLDHFAAAKSWRIEAATSLSYRPPLHCTSLPIALCTIGYLVALITKSSDVFRWTCITGGAFFSHHFRDAVRRGLWFWPVGSTPPFHPWLYFSSVAVLPHILAGLIIQFEGVSRLQNVHSSVLLV